jgi:hypothetical protein
MTSLLETRGMAVWRTQNLVVLVGTDAVKQFLIADPGVGSLRNPATNRRGNASGAEPSQIGGA